MSIYGYKKKGRPANWLGMKGAVPVASAHEQRQAQLKHHPLSKDFDSAAKKFFGNIAMTAVKKHFKSKNRLRHSTPQRARELAAYRRRVKKWLALTENRWCKVMDPVARLGQPGFPSNPSIKNALERAARTEATQCHHVQGRRGGLLLFEPYWLPVSDEGHRWIETHMDEARARSLLCDKGHFNSMPGNEWEYDKVKMVWRLK